MKEYIRFYESLPVCVDREELHRQIRLALNEQNLGKEEKTFFSMVEDMYCMVQLNSTLCKELQKAEKAVRFQRKAKISGSQQWNLQRKCLKNGKQHY